MSAYVLSKYKFRERDAVFVIVLSTLMVTVSVVLIPVFLVIAKVGWTSNL
jgi:alpha-1,4-digalacturonate transport system permease protein